MMHAKTFCTLSSIAVLAFSTVSCLADDDSEATKKSGETAASEEAKKDETAVKSDDKSSDSKLDTITLGAGCFWCIEAVLERVKGIESAVSGYCNGHVENPTYRAVCTGRTGHAEVVKVRFDPKVISLEKLLDVFYELHDPTTLNRQGADRGTQYRSGIYYHNEEQKKTAIEVTKRWNESGKYKDPIVTEIVKADTFYEAETEHQDFYERQPRYRYCQAVIYPKLKKLGLLKAPK